jgi:hypothetical protein
MTANKTNQRIWEFGPYRLDEAERLLLRDGSPVGLTPKARRITNDLHDYDSVSLSDNDSALAAVQTQTAFSIAVAPQGDDYRAGAALSNPSEIFSEVGGGRACVAWTRDGRLIYCSRASGNWDIWLMNRAGGRRMSPRL